MIRLMLDGASRLNFSYFSRLSSPINRPIIRISMPTDRTFVAHDDIILVYNAHRSNINSLRRDRFGAKMQFFGPCGAPEGAIEKRRKIVLDNYLMYPCSDFWPIRPNSHRVIATTHGYTDGYTDTSP